ncbi:MAG: hypothetical protein LBF88_11600, partial [Planctomycetaceae bacterium]|nr:hypothetical protein [Planctomycetaceae bacterium]
KKTNQNQSLFNAEFNVNFDVKTNVKIGKGGGGQIKIFLRIFATIILQKSFLNRVLLLVFWHLLLLSFWL